MIAFLVGFLIRDLALLCGFVLFPLFIMLLCGFGSSWLLDWASLGDGFYEGCHLSMVVMVALSVSRFPHVESALGCAPPLFAENLFSVYPSP